MDNNTQTIRSTVSLNPMRLGLAIGATGVVFYLGWIAGALIAGIYNHCLRMGK